MVVVFFGFLFIFTSLTSRFLLRNVSKTDFSPANTNVTIVVIMRFTKRFETRVRTRMINAITRAHIIVYGIITAAVVVIKTYVPPPVRRDV